VNDRSPVVLVTGAAGFAGSHLVEHLTGSCELVAWARGDPPADVAGLARWARVDLLDRVRVQREIAVLRPQVVYHCAGSSQVGTSWQHTARPLANNVLATHHLFDAVRRAGRQCRVLVTGSAAVYAPSTTPLREDDPLAPASPYAMSKLAQEQLALRALAEDGLDVVVARPFNHTGPRQRVDFAAPSMARQIALIETGELPPLIRVGNLDAQRDRMDVRDTVRAYRLLIESGITGTVYNVASGIGRPIRGVLDALIERARVPVEVQLDLSRFRPQDTPVVIGDASRLRAATGWTPAIPFDRTIDDLLAYWRTGVAPASGR